MEKSKRTVLITLLAVVFLVSIGMVLRQQSLYRQIAASNDEAMDVAGLSEPDVPTVSPAPIEYNPPLEREEEPEPLPEEVATLEGLDLDALRVVNEDVVGWIEIPGTELSYPLVQGTDNQFYLSHNWKGETSGGGSVFLAYTSSRDLTGFHTIAYAHRMRNDSMFGTLKYYRDPDYWQEHPSVYLVTSSGVYRYDIFAAFEASVKSLIYQTDLAVQEDEFIQFCLDSTEIDTGIIPEAGDRILTLSTCTGSGHAKRWVVQGCLVQEYPLRD